MKDNFIRTNFMALVNLRTSKRTLSMKGISWMAKNKEKE